MLQDIVSVVEAAYRLDDARARPAMQALREQAIAIDRARGPMRKTDPDEALRAWQALVSGRWTLLDHFDRDGRRYFIARRNETPAEGPVGLSPRERQVLGWAALGHPGKLIAYELGLKRSTVATHLSSAVRKLGLKGRAELSHLYGGLARAVAEANGRACPEAAEVKP